MYTSRLNAKPRRVCRLKENTSKRIKKLNRSITSSRPINQTGARLGKPQKSRLTSSPTSVSIPRVQTPPPDQEALSDASNDILKSFKKMDSDAQLKLWKAMVDNNQLDINQLRSILSAINERVKFDIVSNVPYEIATYIISFLDPKDLCRAAQTCRYWRVICEDNRLWREKCKEEGLLDNELTIETLFKKRISNSHAKHRGLANESLSSIPQARWKTAYLKHMSILRNWRTRQFKITPMDFNPNQGPQSNSTENNRIPDADQEELRRIAAAKRARIIEDRNRGLRRSARLDPMLDFDPYVRELRCHEESVITCLQFNPKTKIVVSGSDDQTLRVWSSETGRCIHRLEGHTGGVWSSQLSPDDIVISGSTDRTLKIWNAQTGKLYHTLYGHTSTVRCLALNGNQVVSGSRDTTLRQWDINSGECIHVFSGHSAAVRCVDYKDDIIVSGAYDSLVMVWDAKTGNCLHSLASHLNRIYSLQFDGKIIASGSLDSTICIWDATTGKLRHCLEGHTSLTSEIKLKGNLLVSANADSFCKIWDVNTGKCLQTLGGENKHLSAITSVYFNNRHVVTSSDDGTVKLWNINTGELIRNLVVLPTASRGGVVWRIRASYTKLICAVGSRSQTEDTHLLMLDFDE